MVCVGGLLFGVTIRLLPEDAKKRSLFSHSRSFLTTWQTPVQ